MRARRTLALAGPALLLGAFSLSSGTAEAACLDDGNAGGIEASTTSSCDLTAAEAYAKVEDRISKAHTFSYDGVFRLGVKSRVIVLSLVFERAEPKPKFRISSGKHITVHDGEVFATWRFDKGEFTSGEGERAWIFRDMNLVLEPLLLDGGAVVLTALAKAERAVSWGEERDLDCTGAPCREIVIDYRLESGTSRVSLWITPDGLPRKWTLLDSKGVLQRSAEYYNLSLDAEVPDGTFELDPPEGVVRNTYDEVIGRLVDAAVEKGMPEQLIEVGKELSDWELKTPDGEVRRLSEHRGKVVLLDFWATWCGPCKLAMPSVQKVHDDYRDRGVVVYGVNVFESDAGKAVDYMKGTDYTYQLLLDGDPLAKEYGIKGIPAFVVIDREGRAAFSATGATNEHWVRETLDRILAEPTDEGHEQGGDE